MRVQFLSGTETGTAEILCEDLSIGVAGKVEASFASLADISPTELIPDVFYIFVSSTTGNGDIPATAENFYKSLRQETPDLSNIRFAMFGLGDRSFDFTFNQGSEKLMIELIRCNAVQVGERGLHDGSSDDLPEEVAMPWLEKVLAMARASSH
ncbi:MAG: flavodoxin domain-containing protein [Pseudomonadota bacterium]